MSHQIRPAFMSVGDHVVTHMEIGGRVYLVTKQGCLFRVEGPRPGHGPNHQGLRLIHEHFELEDAG